MAKVWIIKCRKCGSFEVRRNPLDSAIISCRDCGVIFYLGGQIIYDPKSEVKK